MNVVCVIPARYASTRLPGKPLRKIGDKTMIRHVYERSCQAQFPKAVYVATDDERIAEEVHSFGGHAIMTDPQLASGTDRVHAALRDIPADIIINVQGDEPFIDPRLLDELARLFLDEHVEIATPVCPIRKPDELKDPNLVRVTRDITGRALYFTRSVIPYVRDAREPEEWLKAAPFFKHIGIYAYRRSTLEKITRLSPSPLEQAEKLEQLRFLENGLSIHTIVTEYHSISVDTEADLTYCNHYLKTLQEN